MTVDDEREIEDDLLVSAAFKDAERRGYFIRTEHTPPTDDDKELDNVHQEWVDEHGDEVSVLLIAQVDDNSVPLAGEVHALELDVPEGRTVNQQAIVGIVEAVSAIGGWEAPDVEMTDYGGLISGKVSDLNYQQAVAIAERIVSDDELVFSPMIEDNVHKNLIRKPISMNVQVAKFLNQLEHIYFIPETGEFVRPVHGHYTARGTEAHIARIVGWLNNKFLSGGLVNLEVSQKSVKSLLKKEHSKSIEEFDVGKPDVIGVAGGRKLDTRTRECSKAQPSDFIRTAIPVLYDPGAACPNILRVLQQDIAPGDMSKWLEWLGSALYLSMEFQVHEEKEGNRGGNGKTLTDRIRQAMLGDDNYSTGSFAALCSNPQEFRKLHRRMAYFATDDPETCERGLQYTEPIQKAEGNDRLEVPAAHGKPALRFINHAKLTTALKTPLRVYDPTNGWRRRKITVAFPNTFVVGVGDARPIDEMLAKVATPEELSGLLNLTLNALESMRARGKPTGVWEGADDTEPKKDFREAFELEPDALVVKQELLAGYQKWCEDHDVVKMDDRAFFQFIRHEYPQVTETNPRRPDGTRPHCYRGIRLKGSVA
jgi:phage/plasmid-associated DNA primase